MNKFNTNLYKQHINIMPLRIEAVIKTKDGYTA